MSYWKALICGMKKTLKLTLSTLLIVAIMTDDLFSQ